MSTKKTPKTIDAKAKSRTPRKKAATTKTATSKAHKATPQRITTKRATTKKAAPKNAAPKTVAPKKGAPKKAETTRRATRSRTANAVRSTRKAPAGPTHEAIAARAAEIWRESGGFPFDNWIRAERELVG